MLDSDRLIDPATGLSTEWHFDIVLDFVFPLAHRGVTLTLVLFGIDEGAPGSGKPPSKEVVTDLGSSIGGVIRSTDLVARYGDDMFMCLLPLCNLQGGLVFADRIRDSLADFMTRTGATVSAVTEMERGRRWSWH